jgi:hypothetical protein
MVCGPFLFILGVITFVLYLLIKYQSSILDENTAPGYNFYNNIIAIISLIQICLIYRSITTEDFDKTSKLSKLTSSIIYLFGVFMAINTLSLYRIFEYYSTDGFTIYNQS